MSKLTDRTSNIDFKINKSDSFVYINNPSSIASKITMSVSSAAANINFKLKPSISTKNSFEPPIKNRITMVDNKSRSLQWLIINSASCTGSHTDVSTKGWAATCNSISTGGMWSAQEMKDHINILDLLAVKLAIHTFTKYRDAKAIHLHVDYTVALINLGGKGYSQSENGRGSQGNSGEPFEVRDHNYCRIPHKQVECSSRLGISKQSGLFRVDAESSNFSERLPNKGFSRDRFVCIPSIRYQLTLQENQILTVTQ